MARKRNKRPLNWKRKKQNGCSVDHVVLHIENLKDYIRKLATRLLVIYATEVHAWGQQETIAQKCSQQQYINKSP